MTRGTCAGDKAHPEALRAFPRLSHRCRLRAGDAAIAVSEAPPVRFGGFARRPLASATPVSAAYINKRNKDRAAHAARSSNVSRYRLHSRSARCSGCPPPCAR